MKDVESRMKDIFSWIINKKNIIIFISLNIKILFIFFITNYLKINLRNINKNLTQMKKKKKQKKKKQYKNLFLYYYIIRWKKFEALKTSIFKKKLLKLFLENKIK